jgi:hypothetical protein
MFYMDPDPGIKNSKKMDLDPVLDLFPVQDPFNFFSKLVSW